MIPPEASVTDLQGRGAGSTPAVSFCADAKPQISVLRKRADFLRAASALRQGTGGFLLQARRRPDDEPVPAGAIRVGFTCSKKIGNAVLRNRAKRRLREIARLILPALAQPGWDYVLIGRPEATVSRDFLDLQNDLRRAIADIHSGKARPRPAAEPARGRRRGKG